MVDVVDALSWCVYLFEHQDLIKTKFKLLFISWWFEQGLSLSCLKVHVFNLIFGLNLSFLKVHVFNLIFVLYILFTFLYTLLIDSLI